MKMGVTRAHFHIDGREEVDRERLNRSASGYASIWAAIFIYLASRPSGPEPQLSFNSHIACADVLFG